MNRSSRAAVFVGLVTMLAGRAAAERPTPRFELAILTGNWLSLELGYAWETAWPRLQAARKDRLLVIDERDVATYDWRAQRIVLRQEVTPRLLAAVQSLPRLPERLRKLRTIWRTDDLHDALYGHGFVVSFAGEPLYGGLLIEKHSELSIRYPVLHAAMDEDRRVVLRFSPIHWAFGSLWDDDSTGDALDSEAHPEVLEVQEVFPDAEEHLTAEERERIAELERLILDRRVRKLFQRLGVPPQAPLSASAASAPTATPPASLPPVAISSFAPNFGWDLLVDFVEEESVAELRVRSADDASWRRLLLDPYQTKIEPDPRWLEPGRHRLEIQLVDWAGEASGPYTLWFDPGAEILAWAKYELASAANGWATFATCPRAVGGDTCLSFYAVLRHVNALREIRYSLDDCRLDRLFPFEPWTDLRQRPSVEYNANFVPIPTATSSVCVQLVYRDGETTEAFRYFRSYPESTWRRTADELHAEPATSTPAVSLRTSRSNSGWHLIFDVGSHEALGDFQYRFADDPRWRSTGLYPRTSPRTGRMHPNTQTPVHPTRVTSGRHRLEVKLVDLEGRESAPYALWFDPEQEILRAAKSLLRERPWATFRDSLRHDAACLNLPLEHRDALSEIRYSFDDCDLDRRFPFTPWNDLLSSPHWQKDEDCVAKTVTFACVQLVFRDGEVTEARRFPYPPPPAE